MSEAVGADIASPSTAAQSTAVPAVGPPSGGLLTAHAHPDDETLANGALLATWARAGRPVTVVTCTRGEQGEVIGPDLAHLEGDGLALAAHREGELARALAALGVTDHRFLDQLPPAPGHAAAVAYVDSGMAWIGVGKAAPASSLPAGALVAAPLDEAAGRLARLIRERRPDVVVSDEPGGGYGHPDHVMAHRITARALALAAEPADGAAGVRVPVVLWSALDEAALRAAYRALAALPDEPGLTAPDPAGPVPSAAVPTRAVDVSVSVEPVLTSLLEAMRAHATQVQAVRPLAGRHRDGDRQADGGPGPLAAYALSNGLLAPVLARESYRVAAGSVRDVQWPVGVRLGAGALTPRAGL
jgi:N-acetyl-1-D-myo-inositol-2-amino-2-deoxy-alpha-D-glucopyranoside deacetylase